jgi:hypothetical protein
MKLTNELTNEIIILLQQVSGIIDIDLENSKILLLSNIVNKYNLY